MNIAAEHPILVEPPVFWEAHFNKTKFQKKKSQLQVQIETNSTAVLIGSFLWETKSVLNPSSH